ILIGSLWGYFRRLDPIMIEIRNFVNNVPSLLLYFLLMAFLTPDFWTIVFLLTMFGWIGLAGFIRNQIIIIRNRDYNIASVTLGSSPKAMITHNLLPYLISVIVTVVSTAIPAAVSSEVGLAFFGLSFSAAAGDITLGQVLTDATRDEWMTYPYLLIAPMIVLVPLTVTFFYIGLALADATDPKNHR
ncbi:MAG: ABC transporter permease subunit, partial [Bacilli bacterium]|nr:ABC transporter permease subunit [Bacilli bacterium]